MPTLQTVLSGASFAAGNIQIPALPSFAQPLIWTYFGGSLANCGNGGNGGAWSNVNAGPNYPAGQNPNYGAGYITCTVSSTAGAQLSLISAALDTAAIANLTMLSVFRTTNLSGAVVPLIAARGSDGKGVGLQLVPNTKSFSGTTSGSASFPSVTVTQGFTSFMMGAVTHTDGTANADLAYDLTHGVTGAATGTATVRTYSATNNWTAGNPGAGTPGTWGGPVDLAFAAVIPGVLNPTTLQGIYAHVKAVLGFRGIII